MALRARDPKGVRQAIENDIRDEAAELQRERCPRGMIVSFVTRLAKAKAVLRQGGNTYLTPDALVRIVVRSGAAPNRLFDSPKGARL